MKRVVALLATALALAGPAGCGGDGAEPGAPQGATLMLDFTPNPAHLGLYAAEAEGFYRDVGVDMEIQVPGESSDAPKLLAAGRVDFAILDIHDLGIAREEGLDLVGLTPIVKFPLAAVLAPREGPVDSPRDLVGRTVGVAGLPSDEGVVDFVVNSAGGDPAKVRRVTVGLNSLTSLAAGHVDAITGFWKTDSFELEQLGIPVHIFSVDRYGAPVYPELVLATSRKLLQGDPGFVRKVVTATRRGYGFATSNSAVALQDLLDANPQVQRSDLEGLLTTFLIAIEPSYFEPALLREWAAWDLEQGILERPLNIETAFDLDG
jgi:putative hydroxymethylpyrimidine transport system substrate-binding protein